MKRALSFLLAFTLLLALTACGQSAPVEGTAPAEGQTDAVEEAAAAKEPEATPEPEPTPAAFEPVTLVDNESALIVVTDFAPEGTEDANGPSFTVSMENRTDLELTFSVRGNVNDVGLYSGTYTTIPAGETDEQPMYWRADLFAAYGLNYVESVAGFARVFDPDTGYFDDENVWTYDYVVDEEFTLTVPAPADADGPAVGEPVSAIGFEPVSIIDTDAIRLTAVDFLHDSRILLFRVENPSDETLYLRLQSLIVNGLVNSMNGAYDIEPGERLLPVQLYSDDFDINGIQYVELLEGSISVYDRQEAVWNRDGESIAQGSFTLDIPAPVDAGGPATVEPEFDFDEVVLVDTEEFLLTLKDYDRDGKMDDYGKYVVMHVENRSDKTISVSSNSLTVNGLTVDGPYLGNIEPGQSSNMWVQLVYQKDAERYGINYLETVSGSLYGYFPDSLVESEWGDMIQEQAFSDISFSFELPAPEGVEGPAMIEPAFDYDEVVVTEGEQYTISVKNFVIDGSMPQVLFYYETGDVEGMYFTVPNVTVDGISYDINIGTPNLPSNARGYSPLPLWDTPVDGSEYVLTMNIGFPADPDSNYSTTVTLTLD